MPPCPDGDTRELNPTHIEELAANIGAVGLIQPLAVDSGGHLLAGVQRQGQKAFTPVLMTSDGQRNPAIH